ncbi:MAG: DUF2807 domain-containing protein [Chitinophagaceae bacterium]|jgi:hypothetical protein|nr:DUF2807 domain-containing protein [Chitinophagaceae bacterium]
MKKILGLIFATAIFSIASAQKVINDVNAEKRNVSGFHGISVSGGMDLYLSQGDEALAVSASEAKYRDRIKTEVKDGILNIWYENNNNVRIDWGNRKLKVYISYKDLDQIKASGACDLLVIGDMKADDLRIDLSGASDLKGGKLVAKNLEIRLSGASDLKMSGNAEKVKVDASGASDFKAYEFTADFCAVQATGASSIHITVNKEISIKASGASDVFYKGEAIIRDLKISGASNVSKKS